ncbi:hypothetical protein V8C44DRAFT_212153 [Trichoderma aethiopicum]
MKESRQQEIRRRDGAWNHDAGRWSLVEGSPPPWLRLRHAITYRCSGLKLIERVAPATLSHYRMRPPDALVRCWLERGLDDHDPCCHAMLRLFGGQCQGAVSLAMSFRFGLPSFLFHSIVLLLFR